MSIKEAKDLAAREMGYPNWDDYFNSHKALDRALELYGDAQRTDGIREGFDAARQGLKVSKVEIEVVDGTGTNMVTSLHFTYETAEDYLSSKND